MEFGDSVDQSIETNNIVFHLENSELKSTAEAAVYAGRLLLTAAVRDLELWDRVLESFSKLRLFKGEDLKTTLIHMLQGKTEELEKKVAEQDQATSQEIEVSKHLTSLAEAGRVRAEQRVQILEAEKKSLLETIAIQVEALNSWTKWYEEYTTGRRLPD